MPTKSFTKWRQRIPEALGCRDHVRVGSRGIRSRPSGEWTAEGLERRYEIGLDIAMRILGAYDAEEELLKHLTMLKHYELLSADTNPDHVTDSYARHLALNTIKYPMQIDRWRKYEGSHLADNARIIVVDYRVGRKYDGSGNYPVERSVGAQFE